MYALVYSTWTAEEWWFVAASILVSIGSMAFAFSGIDLQDVLNGIPGLLKLKHWLSPVAWRLIFVSSSTIFHILASAIYDQNCSICSRDLSTVVLGNVGNLSTCSLVMKREDLHYTREGSRLH